jgi:GT2 family glycosyltransferase
VTFGAVPAECELLDGLFLAAKRSLLTARGVLFDPRFDFHFYDLDFCRTARHRGLRLGTWPICLTHQSSGAANAKSWSANYRRYIDKWDS